MLIVHQAGRYSNRRFPAETLLGLGLQHMNELEELRELLEDTKKALSESG